MERKKNDYMFLLGSMIFTFIGITILRKPLIAHFNQFTADLFIVIPILVWYVFLYRVTVNFYQFRWLKWCYAILLIFQASINSFVNSHHNTPVLDLVYPATFGYITSLLSFSLVFYILLKDIFLQKHDLGYSLLGATNIYFMIPLLSGYFLSIVAVHDPLLVHADPFEVYTVIYACFDYSWYVIAGIDYPLEMGEIIRSIAILESVSANLFIVFVIGRLMIR